MTSGAGRTTGALAVAGAVYLALPTGAPRAVLAATVCLLAVALAGRGLLRLPRQARRSWLAIVAGLAALAATHTTAALLGARGEVSVAAHPIQLLDSAAALLLAGGVASVVGPRRVRDLASTIDAVIITAAAATAVGVLAIQPAMTSPGIDLPGVLPLVVHPGSHLVLLVAVIGLAIVAPHLTTSRLLIAGGGLLVLSSVTITTLAVRGVLAPTSPIGLGPMTGAILIALAVAHPSADALARRQPPTRTADSPWRIVLLAPALLLLPATALGIARGGREVVVAVVTALLVLLLTARLALLLRDLQHSRAHELHEEQRRGHRRLEDAVRHVSDALLVLGDDDRITYATPSATSVFGADPTGWTSTQLLRRVHPEDRDLTHRRLLESLVHDGDRPVRFTTRLRDDAGGQRHVDVVAVDRTRDPDVGGTVLTIRDTTERVELERRLRHLAFHDALTGLANRELLQDRLVQALGRAARHQRPVAVLLCDLDDFKDVNDTHGHAVGDQLLTVVAERLRGAARATDTVARLGGDEFAILCEELHGHRDAIEIARRVLTATQAPVQIEGRQLRAGVSIGIAVDDGQRSGQDLLRDADIALYEAKADGKQRWSVHRRRMTERAQARLQLASDLAQAVELGQIDVAFQPIVALPDGRITGVESLARWEHPERGWVPPAEFIPLAEETGQIIPLGDIVMRTALGTLRSWLDHDESLDLRIGVNVSARQVRDAGLPARMAGWLAQYGIEPARVVLELTESVMLDEADDAIEVMQRLRELGLRFAVDDFGTGYSSLAYLRRLPVDIVKTDRAFVRELGRDAASADLVRAVIEMARSLRLDVVAEGVEHPEQRDLLVEMGCGFAQGYLFSRPVGAEVLLPHLLEGRRPPHEPAQATEPVARLETRRAV
jgi:diguanylate cyclase (GGDEF)-like protein/PAS domain S-box-containing protein